MNALTILKTQTALLASQNRITDEERHLLDAASTLPDSEVSILLMGTRYHMVATHHSITTPHCTSYRRSSAAAGVPHLPMCQPKHAIAGYVGYATVILTVFWSYWHLG